MKTPFLTFLFLAFFLNGIGQTKQTITYFDSSWKETIHNEAEYYRITEKDSLTKNYNVREYLMSGQMIMKGQYSSLEKKTKDGTFTRCYNNGNKESEVVYSEGVLKKINYSLDETGKEIAPLVNYYELDEKPEFPGGEEAMMQWICREVHYPDSAKEKGIQGKVFVQFVINEQGQVIEESLLRGISPPLDKETIRVIKAMPDWKPGKVSGVPVRVSFQLPINFKLF